MIYVVILDDHPVVRKGVVELVNDQRDMQVVQEFGNPEELISVLAGLPPAVVVVDISLGEHQGLSVIRTVKRARPDMAVVVLTIHPAAQYGVHAARAGALGYVTKDSEPDVLLETIRCIATNQECTGKARKTLLHPMPQDDQDVAPHECLSERELQVMLMLAGGRTVSETGSVLNLSVKTISTYRSRILQKMKFQRNSQLTRYAIDHGLLR